MAPILRQWATCDNLWKRRSAILAQLQFKRDTDLKLLYDCIRLRSDPRIFLRKGIGWRAPVRWTDPREVQRYVRKYEAHLSPLTRREALKNVGPYSSKFAIVLRIEPEALHLARQVRPQRFGR